MDNAVMSKLGITMVSATLILNAIGIAAVHFKSQAAKPQITEMTTEQPMPSPIPLTDQVASGSSQAIAQELKLIKDELVRIRAEQRALNQVLGANVSSVDIAELIDNLDASPSSKKP